MIVALALAASLGVATTVKVGEPIPPAVATATVIDPEGRKHALSEAWRDCPAVLVFLRHFG